MSRRLTVLLVAFPFAPVGLDAVGGAERVLTQLDEGLIRAGHRSVVVACEGSWTAGELVATPRLPGTVEYASWVRAHERYREALADAVERYAVDVVHFHGVDFASYLPPHGPPVLATLHLPLAWYPPEALSPARQRTFLSCVSWSQLRDCPPGLKVLAVIENGVDLATCVPAGPRERYALVLGRVCSEKGIHLALDAAHRAGVPLQVAGRIYPFEEHRTYFREQVAPRLDAERRFVGPLRPAEKNRALAAARCLLVPSLAPETSSLVAMEALACGTPVVAFRTGALPEVVEHGRTGLLVADVEEMARAIAPGGEVERIDPHVCRQVAEERFSARRMVERYVELYRRLVPEATREEEPVLAGHGAGPERAG